MQSFLFHSLVHAHTHTRTHTPTHTHTHTHTLYNVSHLSEKSQSSSFSVCVSCSTGASFFLPCSVLHLTAHLDSNSVSSCTYLSIYSLCMVRSTQLSNALFNLMLTISVTKHIVILFLCKIAVKYRQR